MEKVKSSFILTATLYILMFTFGISLTMLGPIMKVLIQQYKLHLSQGGLIMTFQSIGGIAAIILGGIFADLAKKSRLIFLAFSVFSISLLVITLAPSYIILLGLFFILGASTKMLDAIINAYISDIHPDNRGFYLNLLHALFGIGAFIGPLFSVAFINSGIKWNYIFLILGILCTLITFAYLIVLKSVNMEEKPSSTGQSHNWLKLLISPKLLVLSIIMFMYSGHQIIISTWLPLYMEKTLAVNVLLSSMAVSAFWIGIILSRIVCSVVSGKLDAKYLIMFGSLLGGIVLILGIIANSPYLLIITTGITGFLSGAIIPLLVTMACNYYPENSGTVSSMLSLYGSFSWMIFPWVVGIIAETTSFEFGLLISGFALIVAFLLALQLEDKKKLLQ